MVDLCGEGEWFVGTRGGSSDHAAIKFARRGQVAHVSLFPFEVKEFVPFFADHALVVCNSGIQAKKSEGARETYNRKVLGYTIGEMLFERFFPQFAQKIGHLRDITCDNLGVELADLYRMLKALPLQLTEGELRGRYGRFSDEEEDKVAGILSAVEDRGTPYDVRGLVVYGIAECERSLRCPELLHEGDAETLGKWWSLSHDGDRVVSHDADWRPHAFAADISDAWLDRLAADAGSGDPGRVQSARLALQRGRYALQHARDRSDR